MVGIKIRIGEGERKEGKINEPRHHKYIQTIIIYVHMKKRTILLMLCHTVKTLFLKEGSVYDAVH